MKKFAAIIKNRIKRPLNRRAIAWLLICLALFVAALVLRGIRVSEEKKLYDQRAAHTWADGGRGLSQISVFYPFESTADSFAIRGLEYQVKQELIKASLIDEDAGGDGFVTCASAFGDIKVARGDKQIDARAIGTWGDFFRFHPVKLLSGSLYADELLTPDRVLIDDSLSWQLFGSFDIAGQEIDIGGVSHTVAGVFSIDKNGTISKQAGIPDNLIICSLSSLCQLGSVDGAEGAADNGTDAAAVGTADIYGISSWEIVMPDPVKNFAVNIIRTQTGADKGEVFVVENSARFEPEALRENLSGFFSRGIQTRAVVYPYWENIALGMGNIFAFLWLIQVICTAFAAGIIAVFMALLYRRRTWTLSGLWRSLMDKKYEFESKMRYTHEKWEHF